VKLRLIGGEMPVWSDLDGNHGPGPVRGQVLAPLLATASGRTLVAGPHDPALIDALPADDLTLLVRGVPDAEALAARYADRPGVTVCCGGPEKLAAEPPYDTVVALDGLARLSSVEGVELAWGEAFGLLLAALRPGGRLLLAVENFLGLHRLVALQAEVTDSDWVVAGEHDPSRPAGLARVLARLGGAGLDVARTYAAYPAPTAPTVLLGGEILADEELRGFLEATLGRACIPLRDVLTDPGRLAVGALRHGAAAALAPAWVMLARRAPDTADAPPAGEPAAEVAPPEALVAGGPDRYDIRRRPAGGWTRRRDGIAEIEAVPRGRTLESLLIEACLRRDLPTVRELLGAWQEGAAGGVAADQVIVGADRTLTALVPAGQPAAAVRAFATTLIGGGWAHPWPAPADEDDLTLTLAAMAGRELDPAALAAVAGDGPDRPARDRPDARAFRELAATRDRLARELAEARAKALWYEQMLTSRENSLNRAERIIELLSGSGPARAGRALVGGMRAARGTARAAARRVRPRG
jgi:hypothetical protein